MSLWTPVEPSHVLLISDAQRLVGYFNTYFMVLSVKVILEYLTPFWSYLFVKTLLWAVGKRLLLYTVAYKEEEARIVEHSSNTLLRSISRTLEETTQNTKILISLSFYSMIICLAAQSTRRLSSLIHWDKGSEPSVQAFSSHGHMLRAQRPEVRSQDSCN